ncbi:MAG: response regulator transcription factor [Candidatus Xenobia bacterium]
MARVLIVEDDDSIARFLQQTLAESGYQPHVVMEGPAALAAATAERFDAVLLDVMLPGMSGLEVCRAMRAAGVETPVLIVTARDSLEDKVAGLDCGADDYLVKPFAMPELLARLRAVLRRRPAERSVLQVEDLTLDAASRQAQRGGQGIRLSATEYTLLEYLMQHTNEVVNRNTLLDAVWGYDFGGNANVLEVYINYLRNKIDRGQDRPLIHTVRRVGYRLGPP